MFAEFKAVQASLRAKPACWVAAADWCEYVSARLV